MGRIQSWTSGIWDGAPPHQGADRSLSQIPHVYDILRCLVALRIYSVSVACRENVEKCVYF